MDEKTKYMRYKIIDTHDNPNGNEIAFDKKGEPIGYLLEEEQAKLIFWLVYNSGETAGHDSTSMDSSWEETLKDL